VNGNPDLFLTAGGINDNNSMAAPPLFATAADALASFNSAVSSYYLALRAALPNSVLAAVGPWQPRQSSPTNPIEQSKADTIKAALQATGGLWVFMDNLNGGWVNSSGASAPADGPWQTGTGNVAAPAGDGNGDLYVSADGVHPTSAGCLYLGTRIASDLRAAILAL
jgi:lysophospholipase L1-like esterase